MEIKNKTFIDKKTFVEFQRFHARTFKKSALANIIYHIIISILILWLALISFIIIASGNGTAVLYLGWILVIIGITFKALNYFLPPVLYKSSNLYNMTTVYTFTEEELTDESSNETTQSKTTYKNKSLYKVCERNSFFYIYIAAGMALIVSKYGFASDEDLNAAREILKKSVPKNKYIVTK